jgi:hypothetical protein
VIDYDDIDYTDYSDIATEADMGNKNKLGYDKRTGAVFLPGADEAAGSLYREPGKNGGLYALAADERGPGTRVHDETHGLQVVVAKARGVTDYPGA